jgi:hypothetical protein
MQCFKMILQCSTNVLSTQNDQVGACAQEYDLKNDIESSLHVCRQIII